MPYPGEPGFILGLDLGTQSVGWSLVEAAWNEEAKRWVPFRLEAMGARIFDPGVEGDISAGRDESRGVKRRQARGQRRTLARRAGRMHALFLELVKAALLPPLELGQEPLAIKIHRQIDALDRTLAERQDPTPILPYTLRADALHKALPPHALGRVLYHLAQRRGFKSNRKADSKEENETGVVKGGISILREAMEDSGSATLGAHFAAMNPENHAVTPNRIRQRHKGRDMVEREFQAIWAAQVPYHPELLDEALKVRIHRLIFFQRPLKSAAHLIGHCTLEPGRFIQVRRPIRSKPGATRLLKVYKAPRRAALADPPAQRFRILQKVNDLRIIRKDGRMESPTPEQRSWLLEQLEMGDLTFAAIRREWGLARTEKLNLAEGSQKVLPGNRTRSKIDAEIPGLWKHLSDQDRNKLVQLLRNQEDEGKLASVIVSAFQTSEEEARKLASVSLEQGYLSISHSAVGKLLPHLEAGVAYATAVKAVYGEKAPSIPVGQLPRILEAIPTLRNPMVARTLTELRKVVNAVVRRYGKPVVIRVELARDLKKSRDIRSAISKRQGARKKERDAAAALARETGVQAPKARDIEKALLAMECNWVCPYTGRHFGSVDLFSRESPLDIEHIIPFSRSLDDSFANKTLCFAEENRHVKHNRLPTEAYGSEKMAEVLSRVEGWPESGFKLEKLRRFRETQTDPEFVSSQLNDTAMASRLAGEYLSALYGGRWDSEGLRIQTGKGQATAILRGLWGLNPLLGGGEKNRGDHRHHALDALVVALTEPATMQMLSHASQAPWDQQRLQFSPIDHPWEGFWEDARKALDGIVISRRINRKVNTRFHKETNYGPGEPGWAYQRIRVEDLGPKDLDKISDDHIRERVVAQLRELGLDDPKKAFKEVKDHPFLEAKGGRRIPIHKVRIKVKAKLMEVGAGERRRFVESDGNHHLAIYESTNTRGQGTWTGVMVTQAEALRRLARREEVVQRGEGFVMSLRSGDTVEWEKEGVSIRGWVRTVFEGDAVTGFGLVPLNDARKKEDQVADKAFFLCSLKQARSMNLRKVDIDPLGMVRRAHD